MQNCRETRRATYIFCTVADNGVRAEYMTPSFPVSTHTHTQGTPKIHAKSNIYTANYISKSLVSGNRSLP